MTRFFIATPATFSAILSVGLCGVLMSSVSMVVGRPGSFPLVLLFTLVAGLVLFMYAMLAIGQATYQRVAETLPSGVLNARQLRDVNLIRWWPFVGLIIVFGGNGLTFYSKANPFWTLDAMLGFVGMSAWLIGYAVCFKRLE